MERLKDNSSELNERCDISDEQSKKLFNLFKDLVEIKVESTHKYQDHFTEQIETKHLQDPIFKNRGINLITVDYWDHYKLTTGTEKPCIKILMHQIEENHDIVDGNSQIKYDAAKDTVTSIFIINNSVKPTKKNPSIGPNNYYTFYDQEIYDFEQEEVGYEKWRLQNCPFNDLEIEKLIELLESLNPETN